MKLSDTQKKVIEKMEPGKWYCAYILQASLATLDALKKKGVLTSRSGLGSIFSPRTGVEFSLADEGVRLVRGW